MRRPLLLLAVVIGLVAASLVAIALRPAVLGLDLQGGVEVVLQGKATEDAEVTPEAIDRSVEIIRDRVDSFGVAEPEIQTQGDDQIVVALPGADNPEQVVNDLIQPAQLVFINFEANVVDPAGGTEAQRRGALASRTPPKGTARGARPTFYAMDKDGNYLFGPAPDRRPWPRTSRATRYRPAWRWARCRRASSWPSRSGASRPATPAPSSASGTSSRTTPGLLGRDISEARSTISNPGIGGSQPIVTIQFTGEGARSSRTSRASWPSTATSPGRPSASRSSSTARSSPTRRSTTRLPDRDRRPERRADRGQLQPGRGRHPRQADQLRRAADQPEGHQPEAGVGDPRQAVAAPGPDRRRSPA